MSPWRLETSYVLVSPPIVHYNMKWGWNKELKAFIRSDMESEDTATLLMLFLSLGSCCVTMFQERPRNEDVMVPSTSKEAAFVDREELPVMMSLRHRRGLSKAQHCSPAPPNGKNNGPWSGSNRKSVTSKQKYLLLSLDTFLWISLHYLDSGRTETKTHLSSYSTIESTSEPGPASTLLIWVSLWTACLQPLTRYVSFYWPCRSKVISHVKVDVRLPRNERQKEIGVLRILIVFSGAAVLTELPQVWKVKCVHVHAQPTLLACMFFFFFFFVS